MYASSWLLLHRITKARWDGDALLSRLVVDGTLIRALQSSLWSLQGDQVSATN